MAFETINGQRVFSGSTGQTFIFGDYFCVFSGESPNPFIYEWKNLISIIENTGGYTFYTVDNTFNLDRGAFSSDREYLNVRAIIEGKIAVYRSIKYKHRERILPLKYLCKSCDIAGDSFFLQGVYSEKDINSCNISLVSTKIGRYIFLLSIVLAAVIFTGLAHALGNLSGNWLYYLPISIFTSIIVCVVIYLIIAVFARHKYAKVAKVDPALAEEITIIIAPEGFAAVESVCYTGCDLIPWSEASFFIETHCGLVVIRDNKSVFWLPRSFMPKNLQTPITNFIAARVKQR